MGIKNQIVSFFKQKKPSFSLPKPSYTWLKSFPQYSKADNIKNVESYLTSEDVYSIVRRIARTAAMIPIKVYQVKDEKALKNYIVSKSQQNTNTQSLLRKQFLKIKALEEVGKEDPLQKLIDNPNPSYSQTEFLEGAYTFRLLTGNTFIHTPMLEFGVNAGNPYEMWLAPTQWVYLSVSEEWPRRVLRYNILLPDNTPIPIEEMIHVRYFNPKFSYTGNELYGLPPLQAGSKILDRQEAETNYSVNAFQNSGISGVVWNEGLRTDDVDSGALGKMKADFYNDASGVDNARKLLFMAGKIGYQQVGLGPVDMDVLNSQVKTFKKLCNIFGVSDRLFNNDATGSEISVDIAYKDLFTNAVLPEIYAFVDALNKSLVPKFKGQYYVDCDITGIPELQDDMKDMANVFSTLPVMNPLIIAKAFNWSYDENDPNMDKFFIKQGYQTIEDVVIGAISPLPVVTPNGT